MNIKFDNSFAQTLKGCYTAQSGREVPKPNLLYLNQDLAEELGLHPDDLASADGTAMLAGIRFPKTARPVAQLYAGHQFGGFSNQLGDGRALLVGELITKDGKRVDMHLKGSGPTPYSRGGDGKAALGPVLREYLMGEAMHALNIPTSRALAVVTTGEDVYRQTALPGAVLTRIAASHLRVGTFQYFAAQGNQDKVRQLLAYAIQRHDPDLKGAEDEAFEFFKAVMHRQISLIAKWMAVGFIHGVMNTDNVSISGETIDYGPCAFMDRYAPDTVFSSIDHGGRYAYANQPVITQWNMARFAEALLSLMADGNQEEAIARATEEINSMPDQYKTAWSKEMRPKLGLHEEQPEDHTLIESLFSTMEGEEVDFTSFFRALISAIEGDDTPVKALFNNPKQLDPWLGQWRARLEREKTGPDQQKVMMQAANPLYIPRNHLVEEALEKAVEEENFDAFNDLLERLKQPFTPVHGQEKYAKPASLSAPPHITYCGT